MYINSGDNMKIRSVKIVMQQMIKLIRSKKYVNSVSTNLVVVSTY